MFLHFPGRMILSGDQEGLLAISSPTTGMTVRVISDHQGAPISSIHAALTQVSFHYFYCVFFYRILTANKLFSSSCFEEWKSLAIFFNPLKIKFQSAACHYTYSTKRNISSRFSINLYSLSYLWNIWRNISSTLVVIIMDIVTSMTHLQRVNITLTWFNHSHVKFYTLINSSSN